MKWRFPLLALMAAFTATPFAGCSDSEETPPGPTPPPGAAFTIAVSDITESGAFITVDPENMSDRYYFNAVKKEEFVNEHSSSTRAYMDYALDWLQQNNPSFTREQILDRILVKGQQSKDIAGLKAETEYVVVAIHVTDDGMFPEEGNFVEFTTAARQPVPKIDCTFTIKMTGITTTDAVMSITPSDDNVPYFYAALTVEEYESTVVDDKGLDEYMSEYLAAVMEFYGVDMSAAIEKNTTKGPVTDTFSGTLSPGTDYYAFAFGLNEQGRINTQVSRERFATEAVKPSDNKFTVTVSDITSGGGIISLATTNSDTYIIEVLFTQDVKDIADAAIVSKLETLYEGRLPLFVKQGDLELNGEGQLQPDTDYTVVVFGYDGGFATTPITRKSFKTLKGGLPSECTFDVTVDPLYAVRATINMLPSDSSIPYFCALLKKSDYVSDEKIADQVRQSLINEAFANQVSLAEMVKARSLRGKKSITTSVEADTEYYVVLFAIAEDATPEGPVFKSEFKTLEEKLGNATVRIEADKYYDGNALYEHDPDKYRNALNLAYIPAKFYPSDDAAHWYVQLYRDDLSDPADFSDQAAIIALTNKFSGLKDITENNFLGYWGNLTFLAVAEDEQGNFGPVARLFFPVDQEGATPIEELVGTAAAFRATPATLFSSVPQSAIIMPVIDLAEGFTATDTDSGSTIRPVRLDMPVTHASDQSLGLNIGKSAVHFIR